MKTRITTKPKRCLKFEGYIYLPEENDDLRYFASRTAGRLIIYNEFGIKISPKDIAFINLGDMVNHIEKVRAKLVYKRVKKKIN